MEASCSGRIVRSPGDRPRRRSVGVLPPPGRDREASSCHRWGCSDTGNERAPRLSSATPAVREAGNDASRGETKRISGDGVQERKFPKHCVQAAAREKRQWSGNGPQSAHCPACAYLISEWRLPPFWLWPPWARPDRRKGRLLPQPLAALPGRVKIIIVDAARQNPFARGGDPLATGLALVDPWPEQVYEWHREGFDLPAGTELLAEGDMFEVQAFRHGRSYALQFHPDVTHATMHRWMASGHDRLAMPGAKPRDTHFADRAVYDYSARAWLSVFLERWIAG